MNITIIIDVSNINISHQDHDPYIFIFWLSRLLRPMNEELSQACSARAGDAVQARCLRQCHGI